jgi:hypothetical protein
MEAEFRSLLTGDPAVAALVSTRIYWNAIPQSAADPCIVLYKITGIPDAHHGGPSGLNEFLVQIDIRALNFASAVAVRDAVKDVLNAKRQAKDSIEFVTFVQDEQHTSEKPDTTLYHRIRLDIGGWSRNLT